MLIEYTKQYEKWYLRLKSKDTKFIVIDRINRVKNGDFGDHKDLKRGLFELRFKIAGGIRIYYTFKKMGEIILLLVGGNKDSQENDIKKARILRNLYLGE